MESNWRIVSCSRKWKAASCKKRKRKADSSLPFLPEVVIFNILVFLPADILYNVMRYVCRGWYNIIKDPDFIRANLLRSTAGLFLQRTSMPLSAVFTEVAVECHVPQVRKVRYEFDSIVLVSCDGLLLYWEWEAGFFWIANPVTKQRVALPPIPFQGGVRKPGFVYVPSLRGYKVVDTCYVDSRNFCMVVLTVGADKAWRKIDLGHLPPRAERLFSYHPYSIGKFVCWVSSLMHYILALDMESEIVSQLPAVPQLCAPGAATRREHTFGAMGSKLCWMDMVAALHWEVWVLDMELGEWIKLFNLDLTGKRRMFKGLVYKRYESKLFPKVLLGNGEVVVFHFHIP